MTLNEKRLSFGALHRPSRPHFLSLMSSWYSTWAVPPPWRSEDGRGRWQKFLQKGGGLGCLWGAFGRSLDFEQLGKIVLCNIESCLVATV
uniref:Uncharacterized protein n=1 Tax=Poecilia reticulata TaxID=8081 RepID=A0A3P9PZ96_POERE